MMTTIVNDPDPKWASSGRALWVSRDETLIYYTHEYPAVPPSSIADGAVVKRWTTTNGIETVCSKSVGFRNPGNIDVNPVDGKLYVCDRAEEDTTKLATGLFRIDGPERRTRITGNVTQPVASDGLPAVNSFIEGTRGVAFLSDGSYFLAGHKDGNVWFVDATGTIHKYLRGKGGGDSFALNDGKHPPLTAKDYFAQPRSVTIAPNGDLLVVCNDSGFLFRVDGPVPVFLSGPTHSPASFGSNTTWSVVVAGAGLLHHQWLKGGAPVPGGTNATLELTNLGASDLGSYSVAVSNAKGNVTSTSASLAILPKISQQPQPVTSLAGGSATFSVGATR